jgi:hypothetical protein
MQTKAPAAEAISVRLPIDIKLRVEKLAAAQRINFSRALVNLLAENIEGPSWREIDAIAADLRVASQHQHKVNLLGDLTRATDNLLGAIARADKQQIELAVIDARRVVDVVDLVAKLDVRRAHTTGAR